MKDTLGDRIKSNYENRTRHMLMRRSYTIIRIDGKAFHTYTKGLKRPFDHDLMDAMNKTACYLCGKIQGSKFAFVQSDEISILLTDFDTIQTDAWFDGNIQKIVSVSASMATNKFNEVRIRQFVERELKNSLSDQVAENINGYLRNGKHYAEFDSRVFQVPTHIETANYFIWRQQDTVSNSISSAAQSVCSHKSLHGKNMSEQQDLLFQKGINWNDYSIAEKRGRFIEKLPVPERLERSQWIVTNPPIFTQEQEFLYSRIPNNGI